VETLLHEEGTDNPRKLGFCGDRHRRMLGRMVSERTRARCRERFVRLSESSLDRDAMRLEAIADLQRVIGFDRWCWPLADPKTLLPGSGLAVHDFGPQIPRSLQLEYSSDRFAAKHHVARRASSAGCLAAETAGDLAQCQRWDEVMRPVGIGDIALVACRDALGCWGWIEAYRDRADRPFEPEDVELLAEVGPSMGSALRRRAMNAGNGGAAEPIAPGVIVLDAELKAVSWTAGARAWMSLLPSAKLFEVMGILPSVVYPAATLAQAGKTSQAHARLQAVDGRWVMIEAAALEGREQDEVAVTLRSATASETFELLCRVYALSGRERDVVELVAAGLGTRAIAERLFISAHTVQDHLKSVFEKIDIHSRRELLAKLGSSADTN
jgi:DNA-binding CsgD family transcriptional regulator